MTNLLFILSFLCLINLPNTLAQLQIHVLLYNRDPTTTYQCIKVQGDSSDNNAELELIRCDSTNNNFVIEYSNNNLILSSKKCISVNGLQAGSHVSQFDCNGQPNQKWDFVQNTAQIQNGYQIKNNNSGLCLTAENTGQYLDIQVCDSSFSVLSQLWVLGNLQQSTGLLSNVGFGSSCITSIYNSVTQSFDIGFQACDSEKDEQNVLVFSGNNYPIPAVIIIGGQRSFKINSGSPESGVHVISDYPGQTWDKKWRVVNGIYPGPFQLQNYVSGKCLSSSTGGDYLFITDCAASLTDDSYQFWTYQFLPSIEYTAKNIGTDTTLHVVGDSTDNNAALEVVSNVANFLYLDYNLILSISSGAIKIGSSKCLTLKDAGNTAGTLVVQYDCSDPLPNHQKWQTVGGYIGGDIQIKSLSAGLCMTVESDGSIDIQSCVAKVNDNKNQFWSISQF